MSASVGSLNIQVNVELARMQAQLDTMNKKVESNARRISAAYKKMSSQISGALKGLAGVVSVGALTSAAKGAIDLAGRMADLARQNGITAESFSSLDRAAMLAGASGENVSKAMQSLQEKLGAARNGSADAAGAFQSLGLDFTALAQLAPDQVFEEVAKAVTNATDSNLALSAAMKLMGKEDAPRLLALMQEISEKGLGGITAEAKAAGAALTDETAAALQRTGDMIEDYKRRIQVGIGNILVDFQSEAGLQKLGFGLMEAAARFGGRILDAINESNDMVGVLLGSSLGYVADTFSASMLGVWDKVKVKALEIQEIVARYNPATSLSEYSEVSRDLGRAEADAAKGRTVQPFGERVTAGMAGLEKSTFSDDWGNFWKQKADEMELRQRAEQSSMTPAAPGFRIGMPETTTIGGDAVPDIEDRKREFVSAAREMEDAAAGVGLVFEDAVTAGMGAAQNQFQGLLAQTFQWSDKLGEVGGAVMDSITSSIAGMFTKWIAGRASAAAANMAFSVKEGATDAAAKAPGAAMTAISSWGTAAVVGIGAFLAGMATVAAFGGMFADGGRPPTGKVSLVGERGPELFVPDSSGTIIPNHKIGWNGGAGGTGGGDMHVTINAQGADAAQLRRVEIALIELHRSFDKRAVYAVIDARRRGGSLGNAL